MPLDDGKSEPIEYVEIRMAIEQTGHAMQPHSNRCTGGRSRDPTPNDIWQFVASGIHRYTCRVIVESSQNGYADEDRMRELIAMLGQFTEFVHFSIVHDPKFSDSSVEV